MKLTNPLRVSTYVLLAFIGGTLAQAALSNEDIIKLVKAGMTEEVILTIVSSQPGKYSFSADDLIALKEAGVSDKILSAMALKNAGTETPPSSDPANPADSDAATRQWEIGVYYKKDGDWVEVLPEVVNWKTGGLLKSIATAGIVKGDINGNIQGPHSRNSVRTPLEFLIYSPEGVAITEYQLLRLRPKKDYREFRTVTGGVFHQSGGALRDLVPFEGKRIESRTYVVILPNNLGAGEYGFLPSGAFTSAGASSSLGKMYTFRLLE